MIDLFLHLPEKHGFHLTIYEDIHHPAKNKKIGDIKVCSIFETLYEQKSMYSAGQKKCYENCFMKQKCQIQIGIAQHENATTPLNT